MQTLYETKPQQQEVVLSHLPKPAHYRSNSLYPAKQYFPVNANDPHFPNLIKFRKQFARYKLGLTKTEGN